jgi:hypothetical protein
MIMSFLGRAEPGRRKSIVMTRSQREASNLVRAILSSMLQNKPIAAEKKKRKYPEGMKA